MAYKLEIRRLATIETFDAFEWYESQREGLGFEFLDALEHFFQQLNENPFTFSFYDNPIRQGSLERFPYLVIYEVRNNAIVVFSVFMTGRNPDKKRK